MQTREGAARNFVSEEESKGKSKCEMQGGAEKRADC